MNKLELELDEKKVLADGEYNLDELYGYIDYIAVTEKGKRAKMQPKARLDAKKTCVDEAMRVMREQTDISGDKEQENQK